MSSNTQLLNTNTLAKKLDSSPYTIRYSRTTGTLFGVPSPQFIKIGRAVFYESDEVETWLKDYSGSFNNNGEALAEEGVES